MSKRIEEMTREELAADIRTANRAKVERQQRLDAEDLGADEAQLSFNASVLAFLDAADDALHARLIGASADEWASAMERAERQARRQAR